MPKVDCPNCSARLEAPAELDGRTVKCVKCGQPFQVNLPSHKTTVPAKAVQPFQPYAEDFAEMASEPPHVPPQRNRSAPFGLAARPPEIPVLTRIVATIISTLGIIAFLISFGFFVVALQMDTTVGSGSSRVHNQGLMHERETGVIASATVMLISVLTVGFNSVRMRSLHTNLAIKQLAAGLGSR